MTGINPVCNPCAQNAYVEPKTENYRPRYVTNVPDTQKIHINPAATPNPLFSDEMAEAVKFAPLIEACKTVIADYRAEFDDPNGGRFNGVQPLVYALAGLGIKV